MEVTKKYFVGGYRHTGRFHPGTTSPVVDWFATNKEMPSKSAAKKWMKEKLAHAKQHGLECGFSYYETSSSRYDITIDDGKIILK